MAAAQLLINFTESAVRQAELNKKRQMVRRRSHRSIGRYPYCFHGKIAGNEHMIDADERVGTWPGLFILPVYVRRFDFSEPFFQQPEDCRTGLGIEIAAENYGGTTVRAVQPFLPDKNRCLIEA